jgi:hypothetical protein
MLHLFSDRGRRYPMEGQDNFRAHRLPDWVLEFSWNLVKMWLYSPDFPLIGRVVCLDLDTVITGPLGDITQQTAPFITCRGAYCPEMPGGSVVGYEAHNPDLRRWLWNPLVDNPQRAANDTRGSERHWFRQRLPQEFLAFWQDLCPGQVVSYKMDCRQGLPPGTRIVRFHGKPRPHEVSKQWLEKYWQ